MVNIQALITINEKGNILFFHLHLSWKIEKKQENYHGNNHLNGHFGYTS